MWDYPYASTDSWFSVMIPDVGEEFIRAASTLEALERAMEQDGMTIPEGGTHVYVWDEAGRVLSRFFADHTQPVPPLKKYVFVPSAI